MVTVTAVHVSRSMFSGLSRPSASLHLVASIASTAHELALRAGQIGNLQLHTPLAQMLPRTQRCASSTAVVPRTVGGQD